jgi:purine catabolism regulator
VNGLTIKDALELGYIKDCQVIAGGSGLMHSISNVNIMVDLEILNWAKPGELLLTTAYVFKYAEAKELSRLLTAFSEKKLAGLCIKVQPYIEKLDDQFLALADSLGFPILELNYETPFNDIMTPVFKHLFDQQATVLKQVETVHNDMMNILIRGQGAQQVIDLLSETIGNPVLIKDLQFEEVVVAHSVSSDFAAAALDYIESQHKRWEHKQHHSKSLTESGELLGSSVGIRIFPIRVKDILHGHLVVFESNKTISGFDVQALESALPILSMEFLKKLSVQEVEGKYKAEFFEDLISMDEGRRKKAIERCGYYRLNKDLYYNILSIHLDQVGFTSESLHESNQRMLKLIYLLDLQLSESFVTYMLSQHDKRITLLFMWETERKYEHKIHQVVDRIKEVMQLKSQMGYTLGVGRLYKQIENVVLSLKDAQKAIELKGILGEEESVFFDDMGIFKILCQDHLKEELLSFYKITLKNLVDYDKKRDTHLIDTLESYFEANGNLRKMSEDLYTHYNTILYRMNRIEEITEKKLGLEKDRYALQTALKIRKLLQLS